MVEKIENSVWIFHKYIMKPRKNNSVKSLKKLQPKKSFLPPSPVAVGLSVSRIDILFVIFCRIFCRPIVYARACIVILLTLLTLNQHVDRLSRWRWGENKAGRKRTKEKERKIEKLIIRWYRRLFEKNHNTADKCITPSS